MNIRIKHWFSLAALLLASAAWAAPITGAQARQAVTKWAASRPAAHMGAEFSTPVQDVETVTSDEGDDLFHIVRMEGGGFVVTSADDGIQPIIAFSESGDIERSEENPMWVMLNRDLPGRLEAVRQAGNVQNAALATAGTNGVMTAQTLTAAVQSANDEWADLLAEEVDANPMDATTAQGFTGGKSYLSDVRVSPLVQTKWSQSTASSRYCYNYYTPNHYVCGCVATAGAQLMKFHAYPTTSVSAKTFSCWVGSTATSKTMKGGTYAWSSMPNTPASSLTDTQAQAIGKLCYDVGVASRMSWGSGGSGACPLVLASSLTSTFGYANAKCQAYGTFNDAIFKRAIYTNLDAGYPVMLGVYGTRISDTTDTIGHAIVADGYGVYNSVIYTHLNMGWAGLDDAWYALPTIYANGNDCSFTTVGCITYNVFPQTAGELITGRVLNASGSPLSGVVVTAVNGSTTYQAKTNSKGIYALKVTGGKTWSLTATASGYVSASASVAVSISQSTTLAEVYAGGAYSYNRDGTVGNSWGNNFTLATDAGKPNLSAVTYALYPEREAEVEDIEHHSTFTRGESIYMCSGWKNNGSADVTVPFVIRHELLSSSGTVLATWNDSHTQSNEVNVSWWHYNCCYSALQNLAVGTYRCRMTLDAENDVAETDETTSDNTKTVTFTVEEKNDPLAYVVISSGSSSLEPGASDTYSVTGYLTNGTPVSVDTVWTIDSGSSYATLNQSGVLKAGVFTSPRSVVIRATCTYNGDTTHTCSATKTVLINRALTLPEALDNTTLTFTTEGDAVWYGQSAVSYDGVDAARSGNISHGQSSSMSTTITGPGTLSYRYKVSSETGYDWFICSLDGTDVLKMSGTTNDWSQHTIEVSDARTCTVKWTYAKDSSVSRGDDCVYIDQMTWIPTPTPVSLAITGSSTMAAGSSQQLGCTVTMSDGSTKGVSPTWTLTSGAAYGAISSSGSLTAYASTVSRTLEVQAAYEEQGITKTATRTFTVTGVTPPPGKPVITRSGRGTEAAAILEWSAASNAMIYNVYRSVGTTRPVASLASGLTALSYSDTTAFPGVRYNYWVEAVNTVDGTTSDPEDAYRLVSLSATPSSVSVDYGGAVQTVAVKANAEWTASESVDWITLTSNGDNLSVTVAANASSDSRSAVITLTAGATATYPKSIELTVFQNGKVETGTPDFTFMSSVSGDARYPLYVATSATGSGTTLVTVDDSQYLRWGWGNVGTRNFSGEVASKVQIRTTDQQDVFEKEFSEEVTLAKKAGQNSTVSLTDLGSLTPGVYMASVLLNVNGVEEISATDNFADFLFSVRDPVTLQEALDCTNVTFTTNSEDAWFGTKGLGSDGTDCAMTRLLGNGQTNVLSATVTGEGTISFSYRVSTEAGCDTFRFIVDGTERLQDSGEGDWRTFRLELADGEHTFEWIYGKDAQNRGGDDTVFLDQVSWKGKHSGKPPQDLTASDGTSTGWVRLSWSALDEALSYVIDRAEATNGVWTTVYSGAYKSSGYANDETALGGKTYYYRIKAVYDDGETEWSEPESGYRRACIDGPSSRSLPGTASVDAFDLEANGPWTVSTTVDWITFETALGEGPFKFSYRVAANSEAGERKGKLTFVCSSGETGTKKSDTKTVWIYQRAQVQMGGTMSLSEAANTTLSFTTTEGSPWIGQRRISHDGVGAMRSGDIGDSATSRVETVVATAGTLSFWWGTSSEKTDKLTFYVDGVAKDVISGYTNTSSTVGLTNVLNWTEVTVEIPEGGAVLAWEYTKDYSNRQGEDAGFVDQIVWTAKEREIVPPAAWWAKYPDLLSRLGVSDYAVAAKMQSPGTLGSSGKVKADGSKLFVWEDYVAGTDPLDSTSQFKTSISIVDGEPVVTWQPELSADEAKLRNYLTYGKKTLSAAEWEPVADGHAKDFNFFYVTVELK